MRRGLALGVLVAAHLVLRLPGLDVLPLYSDEALGMWRAERVLEGSLLRGTGEGKPLHAWMIAAALVVPGDDIRAARAAHAIAGAAIVVALWSIARSQLSLAAAWAAALLWIALPFAAIFERTVSPDVPLAAASIVAVACALRVAGAATEEEALRSRIALYAAGAATAFVKMPIGVLLAAVPVLLPWTMPPPLRAVARDRLRPYRIALSAVAALLAAIVATRALLGLRPLGFGMHEIGLKVAVLRSRDAAPSAVLQNLDRLGEYLLLYLTPVGTVLLVLALVTIWPRRQRLLVLLTTVAIAYTAIFVLTARDLTAHYLFAALPFVVLAMAWALVEAAGAITKRLPIRSATARRSLAHAIVAAALLAIAMRGAPILWSLWTDPARARFAGTERRHYVEGPWSGYGLPEAARWIDRELPGGLASDETRGAAVAALHVADFERVRRYVSNATRSSVVQVQIGRFTLPHAQQVARLRALLDGDRPVYVVIGSGDRMGKRWREAFPQLRRVATFPKPAGGDASEIWRVQ